MDVLVWFGVNMPCALLGLLLNIFYIFCLIFPVGGEMNIRQPLLILLVLMVLFTSIFQLSLILHLSLEFMPMSESLEQIIDTFMAYVIRVIIPISLWLNVFYCSQIVPVTQAPLIWLKKNIKAVVYFLLISTKIYFLLYLVLDVLISYGVLSRLRSPKVNNTIVNGSDASFGTKFDIHGWLSILDTLTMVLVLLGLCVMLTVTGATGHYLFKHIKKMTKSGMTFNSQALQNQLRVTITSFVQGILYALFTVCVFTDVYCNFQGLVFDWDIVWMLHDMCSIVNTLILGVGQSLFRERMTHLCRKAS